MITPIAVQALIAMSPDAARQLGIRGRDLVAPAGSYRRRPPRYLGVEHATNPGLLQELSAALVQDHPPVYRIVASATVAGQGSVITESGHLIAESAAEFLNHDRVPDGLAPASAGAFTLSSPPTRRVSAPSLLVKRPWWRNYGHWLVDGAALVAIIPWGKMPLDWQIVIGAFESPAMRKVVNDTLAVLAPHVPVIEQPDDEAWHFDELHYLTPVHVPPLFKLPASRHVLQSAFLRDAQASPAPTRFYVQRGAADARTLANEPALIERCIAHGLSVVHPEQMTLQEQALLFARCELVVGVKGAALTNAIFSSSPMTMIALSPGSWTDPFFWDLVGQAGIAYTEIMGPSVGEPRDPSTGSFEIDAALLETALNH